VQHVDINGILLLIILYVVLVVTVTDGIEEGIRSYKRRINQMGIITGDKVRRYGIIQRAIDSGEVEKLLETYSTQREQAYVKKWRRWNTNEALYRSLLQRRQLVTYFMSKNKWDIAYAVRWVASKNSQRLKDRGKEGDEIYNVWAEDSP